MKNNINALFLNFNCNWCPHFETDLEIIKNLMDEGVNVHSISCDKKMNMYCISNQKFDKSFCDDCEFALEKGLKAVNLPQPNRHKLKCVEQIQLPTFKTMDELKSFSVDGINIGFGVATSLMTLTRDYKFDLSEQKDKIQKYLSSANLVLQNVKSLIEKENINAVYLFNGRFIEYCPVVNLCKALGVDYYLHERGSNKDKYDLRKNSSFHRLKDWKEEIQKYWNKGSSDKCEIAKEWFENRKGGAEQSWISFTKDQSKNSLPDNFDKNKENIVIFNSSLDEYYAFDDWQNPIGKDDNEAIFKLIEKFKDDKGRHFYLRIHPNLSDANTTQMKELDELKNKNYANLTVIGPDEKIDSYGLLLNCDKMLTFSSTIGVEGCYWGIPSILGGRAMYEDLDCNYIANNLEELVGLITSNLEPKQKSNALPFGYWSATYGRDFKHFKAEDLFVGRFLNKNIRKKTKLDKLKLKFKF